MLHKSPEGYLSQGVVDKAGLHECAALFLKTFEPAESLTANPPNSDPFFRDLNERSQAAIYASGKTALWLALDELQIIYTAQPTATTLRRIGEPSGQTTGASVAVSRIELPLAPQHRHYGILAKLLWPGQTRHAYIGIQPSHLTNGSLDILPDDQRPQRGIRTNQLLQLMNA